MLKKKKFRKASGRIVGVDEWIPFFVLLKHTNKGKRDSHKMFFEYMHQGITKRTAKSILVSFSFIIIFFLSLFFVILLAKFVDSDTKFAWRGKEDSLKQLYNGLVKHTESVGGACGEVISFSFIFLSK